MLEERTQRIMKKRPHTDSQRRTVDAPATPTHRPVQFAFEDDQATTVFLAGTFNEWHPSATPMVALGGGRWAKTLELPTGVHEYLFVVDGRWVADPGSAVTVNNPFGGINCCVNVR